MLQRLLDWLRGSKTRRLIAERDCRHDGREPMCMDCERRYTVW